MDSQPLLFCCLQQDEWIYDRYKFDLALSVMSESHKSSSSHHLLLLETMLKLIAIVIYMTDCYECNMLFNNF
jgi:hypothetical protein